MAESKKKNTNTKKKNTKKTEDVVKDTKVQEASTQEVSTQKEVAQEPRGKTKEELLQEELNKTKEELISANKETENLSNSVKQMQEQMQLLIAGSQMGGSSNQVSDNDMVEIENPYPLETIITSNDKNTFINLKGNTNGYIAAEDLKEILKNPGSRQYFEDGLLTFADDKLYDKFKIKANDFATKDDIKGIFDANNSPQDVINQLDKWTMSNGRRNNNMFFYITRLIGFEILEDKFNIPYVHKDTFEKYFGIKVDVLVRQCKTLKEIGM